MKAAGLKSLIWEPNPTSQIWDMDILTTKLNAHPTNDFRIYEMTK